jgi:glycosyltransferase involved in cell wall biosynthesis
MRVLCLTFGDATTASTFYRIHQYKVPLATRGIELEIIPTREFQRWDSVSSYDAVLVQKSLLSLGKVPRLRRVARRLLYDVDDAIWRPHGQPHFILTRIRQTLRLRAIAAAADQCIPANGVLATYLKRFTRRVAVLPMVLDEQLWKARAAMNDGKTLRIGWSGHPVNLSYLENVEPALLEVQLRFPKVEIAIFSGQPPRFRKLNFVHVPFAPGKESEAIQSFDIGLLPLPNDEFSAGKSPIKGLQYMASGVPLVATPLPGTRELLGDEGTALYATSIEEWQNALCGLIRDEQQRREIGRNARQRFEREYTLTRGADLLTRRLRGD